MIKEFISFVLTETEITEMAFILIAILFLVFGNILGRVYHNVGVKKEEFSFSRFFMGFIKALCIIGIVIGLTIAWEIFIYYGIVTDEIIKPSIILTVAAISYFVILSNTLIEIFGIKDKIAGYLKLKPIEADDPDDESDQLLG